MQLDAPLSPRGSLSRLLGFLKPYQGRVSIAVAVTLLASVVALAIPWFGRPALDRVVATRAAADVHHAFLVLGVLLLVTAALNLARDVLTNRLGHRIVTDLRQKMIVHALQLPVAYFDRARLGNLMSLLTTDSEQLRRTMTEDPIRAVGDLAMVIGGAVLLLTLDWRLTAALMAVGLAVPVGHRWLNPQLRLLNRTTLDAASSALSRTGEAISNLRLVKSFGRERHEGSIAATALALLARLGLVARAHPPQHVRPRSQRGLLAPRHATGVESGLLCRSAPIGRRAVRLAHP